MPKGTTPTHRVNRDPAYDLSRHIVTGEIGPLSGEDENKRRIDQHDPSLDRNNPMEDFTAGVGDNYVFPRSAAEVIAANMAEASGLTIGADKDKQAVDMRTASYCDDEPSKGGYAYGSTNTGQQYAPRHEGD